ncbi:MAG: leucine-rich repeat domain-containing protein, partial [Thermoanaerobaculia bacterium]
MNRRLPVFSLLVMLVAVAANAAISERERNALLAVYNATNGPNWLLKDGWGGPPGTECGWYSVDCDSDQTTVLRLVLGFNNLRGQIPPAIADLTNLEQLNLAVGELSGPIPPELGQLTKLQVLQLVGNQLSGAIPPQLGSLLKLEDLELDSNQLSGPIPPELGHLPLLQRMSLSSNPLTGTIPNDFAQLVSLTQLDIAHTGLSGPLPPAIGGMTQLVSLNLSNNAITGPLPAELGQLHNLEELDLSENQIGGAIPDQLGNLLSLRDLWLPGNRFSGPIPASLFGLTRLERISLARNQLTGSIADFTRLATLIELSLNENAFTGTIPAAITTLTSLQELDLAQNQFTGSIPADFDRLKSLVVLDLGTNKLTGSIPASLGSLPALEYLGLYDNALTGGIPADLGRLGALRELLLWGNQLTGTIPDSLRGLSNLVVLYLGYNQLSGPVPNWLPELPKLDTLVLATNALTGPIPANITSLPAIYNLDLSLNQLTGTIPPDIGRLQTLVYLLLGDNELTGPIPDSVWDLRNLSDLRLEHLHLSGPLSPRAGGLTKLQVLFLHDNDLTGAIPPAIGSLSELLYLSLASNRFSGSIPRELGQLKKVIALDLSANTLRSPIPAELTGMTALPDGGADFGYNALSTSDVALRDFLNRKQYDRDFTVTQTVTPAGVRVTQTTDRGATVEWTPIAYLYDEGGYQVRASLTPGGSPVSIATTADKQIASITVRGLQPSTMYFFTVATVTHPHDSQRNVVVSDASDAVSAATGPRVLAPADIVVTDTPDGLVQIDGKAVNEDSFTLTNFGDVATALTLEKGDGDFFAISPATFTLGPGASQIVKITSIPQPPGIYYGFVVAQGDGATDDSIVVVSLLSAARAGGNAIAEALTSRVEVAGVSGSDSIGSVTFRNRGTSSLTGILVADVPWIVPSSDRVTIDPGSSALIRFRVVRARRPPGADGTLTGTLSLIYVGALPGDGSVVNISDTTPAGVQITKVTVVDVTKPDVVSSSAPQLPAGEVAYFIAGLTSKSGSGSQLASDLRIVNGGGSKPVSDVRLFYTSSAQSVVATLGAIGSSQSVSLANVVSNVYGAADQTGSIQVRSKDWQSLTVNATLLRLVSGAGTFAGELPVFRSDRALRANQKMYLAGISQSSSVHATLYLEDAAGTAQVIRFEFVDATGASISSRDVQLPAFATTEVTDVPANASTVMVTNTTAAGATGVLAYARMSDDASGDTWSVVDWSLYYDFSRNESMRLPVVQGGGTGGGKRRAVKHSDAASARQTTAVSLFNSGTTEARVRLTSGGSSREVTVPVRQTLSIADVASSPNAQTLLIEPLHGEIIATSRASTAGATGSFGTAVPVVSARSGLRVGQGQIFSGLEDSSASRTDYGFVETGGAATTIRATLLLSDARSLFTTVISKDFRLDGGGFIFVNNLVKSILGPT